ncbi:hypothetical protein RFI_29326, partial [Reticulomyxa filosa]
CKCKLFTALQNFKKSFERMIFFSNIKKSGILGVPFFLQHTVYKNNVKNANGVSDKLLAADMTLNDLMEYHEKEIEFCFVYQCQQWYCYKMKSFNWTEYSKNIKNSREYEKDYQLKKKLYMKKKVNKIFDEIILKITQHKEKILNELNLFTYQKLKEVDGMIEKKNRILDLIQEIYYHLSQDNSTATVVQSDFNVGLNYDLAFQALCENIRLNIAPEIRHELNEPRQDNESQVRIENQNRQSYQDSIPSENQNSYKEKMNYKLQWQIAVK